MTDLAQCRVTGFTRFTDLVYVRVSSDGHAVVQRRQTDDLRL